MIRLVFLALGMFVMGIDSYLIAGLLPGLRSTLGVSIATAGQGVTVFEITYVIAAPLFAVLLANKPARRILLVALSVFVVGNVLTVVATNTPLYLLSRVIAGLGDGLFTPVAVATATDLITGPATGRALSIVWGANSAGTVVGVPVGLWLAERFGWQAALIITVAVALITVAGIALQRLDVRVGEQPSMDERIQLLANGRVLATVGVTLLTATGSLGLFTYVAELHDGDPTWTLGAWAVGGLAGSIAIGEIVDRVGHPQRLMAVILAVLVAAIAVIPMTSSVVAFVLWGAMGWATVTAQQCTLLEALPDHGVTLVALNSSAIGLGSALGSALGGVAIASGLAASQLPYAAALIIACALACQLILPRRFAQRALA